MDALKEGWFSELSPLWPGMSLSLEVDKVLHSEKSTFQDILVVKTTTHGRALILDGIIQCTESDEFSYQEMISFLPLCSHPCPKKVLIVGGGDGGVAREVTKHPLVESVVQVEIDERVLNVSRKYLPFMSTGLSHPKLNVQVGDGFKFMSEHKQEFDVIITDSSDPVGPAVSLFQQPYFNLMQKALRPGGIICSQVGTIWGNLEHVVETLRCCQTSFSSAALAYAAVPTYPTGQISFVLGSLVKSLVEGMTDNVFQIAVKKDSLIGHEDEVILLATVVGTETDFKEPVHQFTEEQLEDMSLRYYTSDVHRSAFVLPRFAEKAIKKAGLTINK